MAIYRPEQAQLTYAAEAAFAGDAEYAKGVPKGSGWTGTMLEAAAGSLEITVTLGSATPVPVVGDFIQIGATTAAYNESEKNHEIRRIEWYEATGTTNQFLLGLDRPTGFFHEASAAITELQGIYIGAAYNNSKILTNLPGVYESVDAPDMESGMEPQFFLGSTNSRSFQTVLKNQQVYDTSLTMTPLDGKPFRWAIGKVTTCAEDMSSSVFTTNTAAVKKGDLIIPVAAAQLLTGAMTGQESTLGHYITFADTGGSVHGSDTEAAVAAMGPNPESRRVVYTRTDGGGTGAGDIWLDQPLQFDHVTGSRIYSHGVHTATKTFRHVISETDVLDTMTWHVHMKDSSETGKSTTGSAELTYVPDDPANGSDFDFDRRYTGGKVSSATITAEESALVEVAWDTINFRGMHHNNRNHHGVTTADSAYNGASVDSNMPFFALMQDIQMSDVDYPNSEPYYFSDGQLKFFGQTFAQIRSFTLTMNNNVEPRYYVQRSFGKFRGPNELREQRREYGLTATVVLPDSSNVAASRANMSPNSRAADAVATGLFRELLLEGDYGKPNATILRGFTATLRFDRGVDDYILIDIPQSQESLYKGKPRFEYSGDPESTVLANYGDSTTQDVGLFIRSAPHVLATDAPLQIELDMFFKNMVIYIKDTEPSYI